MSNTKDAIFFAAIKVFSTNGYAGATVDEIAAVAGVAKGTLYYNFKNKEDIFKFVIQRGIEKWEYNLRKVADSDLDPIEKLKGICSTQLGLLYERKDFFSIILSQLWGTEKRQLELRERVNSYINRIKLILDEAQEKGQIKSGNTGLMAHIFYGSLMSTAIRELLDKDDVHIDKVIEQFTDIYLNGILI
ncbi:MAG: TetR/AcrR family transcriptional regulator [Clostridium perfringens]|nr:TetR/AcrR family transcriptional regulator [Clostridium perfringens]